MISYPTHSATTQFNFDWINCVTIYAVPAGEASISVETPDTEPVPRDLGGGQTERQRKPIWRSRSTPAAERVVAPRAERKRERPEAWRRPLARRSPGR